MMYWFMKKKMKLLTQVLANPNQKNIFLFLRGYSQIYETQFIRADRPDEKPRVIAPREKDFYYDVENSGDSFYIKTNYKNAPNFKLVSAPVNNFSRDNWREVIPNRDSVLLSDFKVFKDYLVLNERIEGISKIRVIGWQNGIDRYVNFDEPTYVSSLDYTPEFNTNSVGMDYSSMISPTSVIDYNMQTGKRTYKSTTCYWL